MMQREATKADIGKHLLFGITCFDAEGNEASKRQGHGTIIDVTNLVAIRLHNTDEEFPLPPEVSEAEPGEYRIPSTGEVVVNPDLLTTWTVQAPKPHKDKSTT